MSEMPASLKRKGSLSLEDVEESSKRRFAETKNTTTQPEDEAAVPSSPPKDASTNDSDLPPPPTQTSSSTPSTDPASARVARFAALKARNASSRKSNLSAMKSELARASIPSDLLPSLSRKRETAEHKLLRAETEASGEDFERKRAWDWTVEESERWDERVAGKKENRERNKFRDYGQEAEKIYDRQVRNLEKDGGGKGRRVEYEVSKRRAIEEAVANGGLEVVELEGGEMIAVDRDGSFVLASGGGGGGPGGAKPSKEAVDRLVADIRKAEETRLKKRRERGKNDEDGGDVTYINEKNKQFNLKLARFYDKYTADIRESFERGTAI